MSKESEVIYDLATVADKAVDFAKQAQVFVDKWAAAGKPVAEPDTSRTFSFTEAHIRKKMRQRYPLMDPDSFISWLKES